MRSSGLLAPAGDGDGDEPALEPTEAGQAVFRPVRQAVSRLTQELYADLPPADLEATHRTLEEVTHRANAHLAAAS
jgi:DNA-binding MarR family transcriptional regulator